MVETIAYSVISAIICSGILFAILNFGVKRLSKQNSSGAAEQGEDLQEKIVEITGAVDEAVASFSPLLSADALEEIEQTKAEFDSKLNEVKGKLSTLEKSLSAKQKDVDKAESSHNDLKRSKEAAAILADELKEAKDRLESEHKTLEEELTKSLSQLEVLSSELNLNPEAEAGITKIQNALENSRAHLKNLIQIYSQGSNRFINLQGQYRDLEKEFTKLVEKELTG